MAATREQIMSLFAEVAKGKSVTSQLDRIGIGFQQFYELMEKDKELGECYAHARKHQAEAGQSMILEAAAKLLRGEMDANQARVAIDALKWNAARMHPAIYGDKVSQEITGKDGGPIVYGWGGDQPKV